ncbi:hypothetical protein WAF17_02020 [Bernardetia sp. ABR2-2B]
MKSLSKVDEWAYYSIIRTARGLLVIYKANNDSFIDYFHYYHFD